MKPSPRRHLGLRCAALASLLAGCSQEPAPAGRPDATAGKANPSPAAQSPNTGTASVKLKDRALAPYRIELLEQAFRCVSKMPEMPHIKDRSTAQYKVVEAMLRLHQPARASARFEQVHNWRQGLCHAALAEYCAEHGPRGAVAPHIDAGKRIAESVRSDEDGQEWYRDRIRARIARALLLLGERAEATKYAGVVVSELGAIEAIRARQLEATRIQEQLELLDKVAAQRDFDLTNNAIGVCLELYARFYQDANHRGSIRRRVEASFTHLPVNVRFDALVRLGNVAAEHADKPEAASLAKAAAAQLEAGRWLPGARVVMDARLAELLHRAGDSARAREVLAQAQKLFDAQREQIQSFDRAESLRPIAEAYQAIGDTAAALAIYRRAVEDGAENPNARPRAEDLAATCCSMAVHGVEPDAGLRARLSAIENGLKDPW